MLHGFNLGTSNKPTTTGLSTDFITSTTGYKVAEADNMFYPHKSVVSDCVFYWISSPVMSDQNGLYAVHCSGRGWNSNL